MNIEQMRQRAVLLDKPSAVRRYTPLMEYGNFDFWNERDDREESPVTGEDLQFLMDTEMRGWKEKLRGVEGPRAGLGNIATLEAEPPTQAIPAVTLSATESRLYDEGAYAPFPAKAGLRQPLILSYVLGLTVTTTATASPTITFAPRVGSSNAGAALGASASIALTASITSAPIIIRGDMEIYGVVPPLSAGSCFATFQLIGKLAAAANGVVDAHHIFGFTTAAPDWTAASNGLWMGVSSAVTTTTVTVRMLRWGSWN